MPRWEPNAVGRLQHAAIELFEERGFDGTTVSEIAQRADLTERTFYNHFADKREVLFGPRSAEQQRRVVERLAAAEPGREPLDAVVDAFRAAADELFVGLQAEARRRRRIVDAHPDLREREDGKRGALTAAIAAALEGRGLDARSALLTARTGVLVDQDAQERWTRPAETRTLGACLDEALTALRGVVVPREG